MKTDADPMPVSRAAAVMEADSALYHLSGLVDLVRETSQSLLALDGQEVTAATGALVRRYNRLRTALVDLPQSPADVDRITLWTPELAATAGLAEVYDAAATLARVIDLVVQVDAFVAGRIQQRLELDEVISHAPFAYPDTPPLATPTPPVVEIPGASVGHYL